MKKTLLVGAFCAVLAAIAFSQPQRQQTAVPIRLVNCDATNLAVGFIEFPFVVGNGTAGPYPMSCAQLDPQLFHMAVGAAGQPIVTVTLPQQQPPSAQPVQMETYIDGTVTPFSGPGTTVSVTCPNACSQNGLVEVFDNGLSYGASTAAYTADYTQTISGNVITITFTAKNAPTPGDVVKVRFWHLPAS